MDNNLYSFSALVPSSFRIIIIKMNYDNLLSVYFLEKNILIFFRRLFKNDSIEI